jgi:oligoribonuclease
MNTLGDNSFNALQHADEDMERIDSEIQSLTLSSRGDKETPVQHGEKLEESLIWIDLEMTGLDVDKDSILQIACIVTNGTLTKKVEGEEIVIHHSDDVLDAMNEWCQEHHGKSGLIDDVRASTIDMKTAEERVLEFIKMYAEENSPIAGNTVHVDVQFLKRYMPRITDYAHYRIVDVSTVGELCKRWYPKAFKRQKKKVLAHTAMSDIRESIEQLQFLRKNIFKKV